MRDDLGRERHAYEQNSHGLAEDDRDYLQVMQVQQRRDGEPGGENHVEVDVQSSGNDPQGRQWPLGHKSERANHRTGDHQDYCRATAHMHAHDDESSCERILGKLVSAKGTCRRDDRLDAIA